jgi:hypothetical protein
MVLCCDGMKILAMKNTFGTNGFEVNSDDGGRKRSQNDSEAELPTLAASDHWPKMKRSLHYGIAVERIEPAY